MIDEVEAIAWSAVQSPVMGLAVCGSQTKITCIHPAIQDHAKASLIGEIFPFGEIVWHARLRPNFGFTELNQYALLA